MTVKWSFFEISPTSMPSWNMFKPCDIGVKDVDTVQVIKTESKQNYTCNLTFKDKNKLSCNLTKAEVCDLWNHASFMGTFLSCRDISEEFNDLSSESDEVINTKISQLYEKALKDNKGK